MSIASKLKIENRGIFVTSAFYAAAGVVFMVLLLIAGSAPYYLGIIGIFSLITAYGIFKKRGWAIWFILILFFVGTTFSATIIYYVPGIGYSLATGAVIYLILTWVFTAYALMKRKTFES